VQAPSPIAPSVIEAVATEGAADVVIVADSQNALEAALNRAVTKIGEGVYQARLDQADLNRLGQLDGATVSVDRKVTPLSTDDNFGAPVPAEGAVSRDSATVEPSAADFRWGFNASTTVSETDPDLAAARTATGLMGKTQVIAVVDSGIDTGASGLSDQGKVVKRVDFSPATSNCSDAGYLDPLGHGTHVASIAAGAATGVDPTLAGVAPGAHLVDVRVFACDGSAMTSNIDAALSWILTNHNTYGITVANMSLGSPGSDQDGRDTTSILVNRLVAAGVSVVIASGNEGDAAASIYSPGTAQWATTVGSVGAGPYGSFLSYFSSRGPIAGRPGIDLLAPGSSITAAKSRSYGGAETAITLSGTSMASPYVAGLTALVREANPAVKPHGTACSVSVSCPEGVVNATMTDGILTSIATSDWFTPGIDDISGAGLVDASATVLGIAPAAVATVTGAFDGDGSVVIKIPPHDGPVAASVVTDDLLPPDASGAEAFDATFLSSASTTFAPIRPCSLEALGTQTWCAIAAGADGGYASVLTAPASTETVWLRLSSTTATGYRITIAGAGDSVTTSSGFAVDAVALDGAGTGVAVLRRTTASASATTVALTTSSGIEAPASAVLPAGAEGSSVSIPLSLAPTATFASPHNGGFLRVEVGGTLAVLSSVSLDTSAHIDGLVTWGGVAAEHGDTFTAIAGLANDGTIVGTSTQPAISRGSDGGAPFRGIFVVAPGASDAEPLAINQTVVSGIGAIGVSDSGSRILAVEDETGAGIVAGDTDARAAAFVYDRVSGLSYEVGDSLTPPTLKDPGTLPVMARDGQSVAFMTGSSLFVQSGAGFATRTLVGTVSGGTIVKLVGVTSSGIVAEMQLTSASNPSLVMYSAPGGTRTTLVTSIRPGATRVGASGATIGFANLDGSPGCVIAAMRNSRTFSTGGRYVVGSVAPSGDCATVTTTVEREPTGAIGSTGFRLIRASGVSTMSTLNSTFDATSASWVIDSTGTVFATLTGTGFSASDTNGLEDIYRGARGFAYLTSSIAPSIELDAPAVGATLTAKPGTWVPGAMSFTYEWLRGSTVIAGARSATYDPVAADVDSRLSVRVTASTSVPGFTPTAAVSAATAPIQSSTAGFLPSLSSLSPGYGPTSGGTRVTLTGVRLSEVSQVTFGGVAGTDLVIVSDTELAVTTPTGLDPASPVTLTAPVGSVEQGFFAFIDAPLMTMSPQRAIDVRSLAAGVVKCYDVSGTFGVPFGATAVIVNITTSGVTSPGNVVVYPDSDGSGATAAPHSSSVNFEPGADVANSAFVELPSNGRLCAYARGSTLGRLIIDVTGYSVPGSGVTVQSSQRLFDTRHDTYEVAVPGPIAPGVIYTVPVAGNAGVPADATAVVANVTVTSVSAAGHLKMWAAGAPEPPTSVLNYAVGQDKANSQLIGLDSAGMISFMSTSAGTVQVVVDIVGYVTTPTVYRATDPTRVVDTRKSNPIGPIGGRLAPGSTYALTFDDTSLVPAGAAAVVLNVTAVHPSGLGHLRVFPDGAGSANTTPPTASSLNYIVGRDVPNLVIVALPPNRSIAFYNHQATGLSTDLVVDLVGYILTEP